MLQKYCRSGCCKNIVVFPTATPPTHTLPYTLTTPSYHTPSPHTLSAHPYHTPLAHTSAHTLTVHPYHTPSPHPLAFTAHLYRKLYRTPLAYHRIPSVHILSAHPQHTPFQDTAHITLRHSAHRSRIVKNGSMY